MLAAWVQNDDSGSIKILRSRDHGYNWQRVNAPLGAQTYGTPGLCCTRLDDQAVWILVWSNFDRADQECTGCIRFSVSSNEGDSWSPPGTLDPNYKAVSGVSAAADQRNHALVSFAWAAHAPQGMNRIRTFACEVIDGQLTQVDHIRSDEVTRTQPALAFDESANRFILAWRDQNFLTSVSTARMAPGERRWSDRVRLEATSNTAPALAAMPPLNETVLWYAAE